MMQPIMYGSKFKGGIKMKLSELFVEFTKRLKDEGFKVYENFQNGSEGIYVGDCDNMVSLTIWYDELDEENCEED